VKLRSADRAPAVRLQQLLVEQFIASFKTAPIVA
jgi:hypothetical protein